MKCSYISEKISKFFHRLIFGNLKITKTTKIILPTINFPKDTPTDEWFVSKCKSTFKKFPSYMESFVFVFCLNFQVKKRKKQTQRKDFAANFAHKNAFKCFHHKQKNAWTLYIYWVPGARRRRRALRTWDNNIKTIFIKIPAAKELRRDNAYTKLCNFLWVFMILCLNCWLLWLAVGNVAGYASLWFVVARCGSLWFVVARCGSLCVVVVRCGSLWLVA